MPNFTYANNVSTTLSAAITSTTQTSITLSSTANLPTITAGQTFVITLTDAATNSVFEIMYATTRTGAVLTVLRGQEGTAAATWLANDIVYATDTAAILANFAQAATAGAIALDTSGAAQTKAGALTVTGGLTSGAGIVVGGALTGATAGGFSGNVSVGGTLGVTGITTLGSSLGVTTNASVGGTLSVTGNSALGGNTTVGGTLGVTGATTLNGGAVISGALAVTGAITGAGFKITGSTAASGSNYGQDQYLAFNSSSTVFNFLNSTAGAYLPVTGGTYTTISDAAFKKNVAPLVDALATLAKLKPSSYTWIDSDQDDFGFIAQDVQPILPQIVRTGANDSMGVVYTGVTTLNTAAIQQIATMLKAAGIAGF